MYLITKQLYMTKKVNVQGNDYEIFITKTRNNGYRLSAITTDRHPYRIIRDKLFPKDTTEKNIEQWAVDILSSTKN